MPFPLPADMHVLAQTKFGSFKLKVPPDWKNPIGDMDLHYKNFAFKDGHLSTIPNVPGIPVHFGTGSLNKYHTDAQKFLITKVDNFMKHTAKHVCESLGKWHSASTIVGAVVNGPTALGGTLVGPPLLPMLLAGMPPHQMMAKYYTAAITVIATEWQKWMATVKIPGLSLFPKFAAFPGPMAPPTPSIPIPVTALQAVHTLLSSSSLTKKMVVLLAHKVEEYKAKMDAVISKAKSKVAGVMPTIPGLNTPWMKTTPLSTGPFAEQLFDSITHSFEQVFNKWKATTMVTQIMGQGPVPSFAPPASPVGPVVGGIANMIAGGFK